MKRPRMSRLLAALAICIAATTSSAALMVRSATPAAAAGPTVYGAGSTWVAIALDQWRADIFRQGYSINYQSDGSSAGREFYIINQVDFAASEIPFQPDEVSQLQGEHKSYQYVPDVAGGTSLMYNLHSPSGGRITSLQLNADATAKIFTGGITSWQDPEIQALNPGLQIIENTIIPVIRSDGSGTSAQFSLYLTDQASGVWNSFVNAQGCPAPCSLWPPFAGSTQQSGSDGVANFVANDAIGSGAIGYVEAGYAYGRGFPVASLRNASGNFAQPSSGNVATALTHATLNADLTQNLVGVYRAPESNAYPMSSYSYMITQTSGFDPSKGFVLGTWMLYIACTGQQEATPLGYSPLPRNLVQDVFDAVRRIPGAPVPPPVDAQHCLNPTITGEVQHGPGEGQSGPKAARTTGGGGPRSAATAAAAGTPTAGSTGTPGASAGADGVATLSDKQRQALFALAEQAAKRAPGPAAGALIIAAVITLMAVFGPILYEWRRRAPSREGDRSA